MAPPCQTSWLLWFYFSFDPTPGLTPTTKAHLPASGGGEGGAGHTRSLQGHVLETARFTTLPSPGAGLSHGTH